MIHERSSLHSLAVAQVSRTPFRFAKCLSLLKGAQLSSPESSMQATRFLLGSGGGRTNFHLTRKVSQHPKASQYFQNQLVHGLQELGKSITRSGNRKWSRKLSDQL